MTAGKSRRDIISHSNVTYIAVHFQTFNLPPGDSVTVRNEAGSVKYVYRLNGRTDRGPTEGFYATFIPGNVAVVEYRSRAKINETAGNGFPYGYEINAFVGGGVDVQFKPMRVDLSSPAKCFSNGSISKSYPEAYKKSRAIARLLVDGQRACMGWLIGNEGHLLANRLCIGKYDGEYVAVDVEFDAEGSSCNDRCNTIMGCGGKVVATIAKQVANSGVYDTSDWALLKLRGDVDVSQYGYLQLRKNGPQLHEEIYIPFHSNGYGKRIVSVGDDGKPATVMVIDTYNQEKGVTFGTNVSLYYGTWAAPVIAATDNAVIGIIEWTHDNYVQSATSNLILEQFKDHRVDLGYMTIGDDDAMEEDSLDLSEEKL